MEKTVFPKKKFLRWDESLALMDAHGIRICKSTLYAWAITGTIISIKINGKIWFTRESIEDIVNPSKKIT